MGILDGIYNTNDPLEMLKKNIANLPRPPINPTGLVSPGNINIYDRPIVPNPTPTDPTRSSTVRSASFGNDAGERLIPTVSDGADGRPAHLMGNKEALGYANKYKQDLGTFNSPENATNYAQALHLQQAKLGSFGGRTTLPSVITPDIKNAISGPSAPALVGSIAMPSAMPQLPAIQAPIVTQRPPTQTEADQAKLTGLRNSGDGVSQINNPLLRGIARAGDIAASVFAPRLAQYIPGTQLHHQVLVGQAQQALASDQASDQAGAVLADSQAQAKQRESLAEQEQAKAEALLHPQSKPTPGHLVISGDGSAAGYQDGEGNFHGLNDPTVPQGVKDVATNMAAKPTKVPLAEQPLDDAEAKRLNNLWDNLADKHHLPKGQFVPGMTRADATTLASGLNNVVGKQQGDTHVTISMQGLQDRQNKNAALDMNDPSMAASVAAVANGSMKLGDVFGRGATTAQKAAFASAVKNMNPNYNSGDHDVENAVRRDFTSGHDSNTLNAVNTAYSHLDTFATAAKALKNGDVKGINSLANSLGVSVQNGASPQVVAGLVKEALKGEMARALTGAGATVDEQRNIDASFSTANSLPTMLKVAEEAKTLLKGKQETLRNKYKSGTTGTPNFISDAPSSAASDKVDGHWDPVARKVVYH